MRTKNMLAALAAAAVMIGGCANQKEPAEQAVAQVEASLSEFKADAEQYAAEELKGVEESIARLKNQLASQDYKAAVMGAPAVASTVAALKETVANKKAEAEQLLAAAQQEWTGLAAEVPELVAKLQARFDARKPPKGLDKASFENARQEFEALKASWGEATSEFASGAAADAVRKARIAKDKAEELAGKLGA